MKAVFEVFRYDPRTDREGRLGRYELEVEPAHRILDCLNRIRWEQDPSLSFRASCAHGICGSDAVRINGTCALACQRMVKDYGGGPITVEPLPGFPVLKDLVVDLDPFFEKYRAVRPYLLPAGPAPDAERPQSPEERAAFDEAVRCILCACCTAACPVTSQDPDFLGPAALLRAFRYLFDSRDAAGPQRARELDRPDGIWGCKGHGKCTEVCPKEIDVRKWLGRIKKKLYDAAHKGGEGGGGS
jgi:succinate dehydrogenase / fumarate reductase iron-sulfur subunit